MKAKGKAARMDEEVRFLSASPIRSLLLNLPQATPSSL